MTRSRIALQLAATLAAVLILLIASSTLFGLHSLRQANLQVQENHLNSEARLLSDQLTTFHRSLLESTQRLGGLFERRFSQGLRLDAADQVTVGTLQTPALLLGSTRLNNDFALVDEFNSLTGGVATVFVRDGDEFTRVTTSLTKQDGQRAIGTRLDHTHPAYSKLLDGQGYVGRAVLFGRYYMTQYTPVRDGGGRMIAVLFVGFDYTDAQRQQFDALKAFRIGQGGSLAILDASNQWLVAPGSVGEPPVVTDDIVQGTTQAREGFFWSDGSREYVSVSAPFVDGPWQVIASMPMDEVGEVTREVGWKLILGNLLAMVLAVGLIAWLLRRRLRPLASLVQQAQALGEGQLSARCHLQNKDEVGELAGSFNRMGDALSTMVERVRGASGQVNGGAKRLADLSARALSGIERQSGEVVSMAGAVEEFSATAQHIADSMRETERLAADNAEQTRSGLDAMDQASRSLEQIASTLAAATELLNTLGQRSQEIGGIVGVITSIAEQTNLLALNAAIEAARAGEQGRGFAVVADEVRSLAARTGEATSEISRMILSIQGETGGAIATMQTSNQLMQAGLERNAEVAAVLSRIAQQTQAAGERFMLITSAAHEQSETATSLSRNLLQVEASNREQRDVLADLDRTAHELESLAGELRREVERFH